MSFASHPSFVDFKIFNKWDVEDSCLERCDMLWGKMLFVSSFFSTVCSNK